MRAALLLAAMALAPAVAPPVRACGPDSDCAAAGGGYRIALPAPTPARPGALVYLHGWQDTPEGVMRFEALRAMADRLGVALIAPRGADRRWMLPDAFTAADQGIERRDDIAYVNAIVENAIARFGLDRERIVVSGFSLGGSMAWYIACAEGTRYAGYIPVAGAFWEPYVSDCTLPLAEIRHVHGLADETVPLAGRKLSVATQGDTRRSFEILRRIAGCDGGLEGAAVADDLTCAAQACGGTRQELCLHEGGHSVKPAWIERAWHEIARARGWT
jgi:polyhydroxybutyrate depolymerase